MNKVFSLLSAMALVATPFFGAMQKKADAKNKPSPCACLESGMGLPMDNTCYAAGYNAPANIHVKGDIDFTGQMSFIYWFVGQDDMSVGTKLGTDAKGANSFRTLYPDFDYMPGFKVGGAMDLKYDDWRMFAEYTWLHGSTHHTAHINSPNSVTPISYSFIDKGDVTAVKSKWKMHLDMLDYGFNRAFYRSKKITLSPVAGLRALWIRENLHVNYPNTASESNTYNAKSHSWAIGPMLGTNASWLFDYGMRFEGKAAAALVYTRYTQLKSVYYYHNSLSTRPNFSSVNPMAELGMGLGWGTYLDDQQYYLDFSARYDFNIFWNQNQLDLKSGDLFMHGLTLNARFDF